jgi:hypothetical protein
MEERKAGHVKRKVVAAGSKSEHEAIVVHDGQDEYVLRRRGGNAFEIDVQLAKLVGKRVAFKGTQAGNTFLVDDWDEVQD